MKKFYLFIVMLFAAFASNAETLSAIVYKWDDAASDMIEADEPISVEAEINGPVITLPNFLGSDVTFEVTASNNGIATHNQPAGDLAGSFTLGSFGTYEGLYLYAGKSGYYDFEYYEEGGSKILMGEFYAGPKGADDWFNVDITLPDSYEPVDVYADMDVVTLPVTLFDGANSTAGTTFDVRAIIEGGTVTLLNLFGVSEFTYTIDENGNITPGVSGGYVQGSYTYGGIDNAYIYFYGPTYLTYNAQTKTIRDYIWLYYSNVGFYYTIQLPESFEPTGNIDVQDGLTINVLDYTTMTYGETVIAPATVEGSTITFEKFLGSESTLVFNCFDDSSITLSIDGVEQTEKYATVKGDIDLGTWQYDKLMIYLAYCSYAVDTKGQYLTIATYGYAGSEYQWLYLYVLLPDDYVPAVAQTGVKAILSNDNNAPVEYYNLQGIKVNAPANGIFIRRQGNDTQKVIIR